MFNLKFEIRYVDNQGFEIKHFESETIVDQSGFTLLENEVTKRIRFRQRKKFLNNPGKWFKFEVSINELE